jgi:hypothetical protein
MRTKSKPSWTWCADPRNSEGANSRGVHNMGNKGEHGPGLEVKIRIYSAIRMTDPQTLEEATAVRTGWIGWGGSELDAGA